MDNLENILNSDVTPSRHPCYVLYELTPAPWGDDYRHIKIFDRKEDAQLVLDALEKVNIDFSLYKIIEREY